jgi:hypothetical protein
MPCSVVFCVWKFCILIPRYVHRILLHFDSLNADLELCSIAQEWICALPIRHDINGELRGRGSNSISKFDHHYTLSQNPWKVSKYSSFGNAEVISSDRRKLFINSFSKTTWKLFIHLQGERNTVKKVFNAQV